MLLIGAMKNVNRRASQRTIKLSQSLIIQTTFAAFVISFIYIWFHIVRSVHQNGGRNGSQSNTYSLQKQRQNVRNESKAKATVAYAWTLAKCEDFQSSTVGMIDAALVLQYSVHQISSRVGKSEYDYQMYVFVHESAEKCAQVFREVGYTVLVFPQPIKARDIRGSYLRKNVDSEWCCGSKEFIKLYAYTLLQHPIVVHVDIDFAFFKPMDELFDAMLYNNRLSEVRTQYPVRHWPANIEAFITRDYPQLIPGDDRSLFQAGFMVVKPNKKVFDEIIAIILEGNFAEGWNSTSGWGGLGYSGKVGAKAMQGLIAYYYDSFQNNSSVELNGCHYNWMGGDVFYRNVPRFYPSQYPNLVGKCRNGKDHCEDCQKTPFTEIGSIHYTNCRKPWNCIGTRWIKGQPRGSLGIDERNTNFSACMIAINQWHQLRKDLEDEVIKQTTNKNLKNKWRGGDYMRDTFLGHCKENGPSGYISLNNFVPPHEFRKIYE